MVAVKKYIVRLVFLVREFEKIYPRYVNITVAMPGSKVHKAHGLGDDKALIKAWGPKKGGEF